MAPLKLTELDPQFLKHVLDDDGYYFLMVDALSEADGISFLCPKCYLANKGRIGTHSIICWDPSVPENLNPKPGRWKMVGTSFQDLSLVAGSSSILLTDGCRWHGFIREGQVTDA